MTPPISPGPAAAAIASRSDLHPGPVERSSHKPVDDFDMGARRDLRHHAAIGRVLGDLAHDVVRQDFARPPGSSCTTAAAVSSQVVSIPRTRMSSFGSVPIIGIRRKSLYSSTYRPIQTNRKRANFVRFAIGQSPPHPARHTGQPFGARPDTRTRRAPRAAHGIDATAIEIVAIKTSGDPILNVPLSEAGGKGLFTKELDLALLQGDIALAVHSAKDLPTFLPTELEIAGYLPREDVRDAWISPLASHPLGLPSGSVVGTASLRRGAMVKRLRPDIKISLLRGNVETRLAKVAKGEAAATLLAFAGLKRLGLEARATLVLDVRDFVPAAGQGAIAITMRRAMTPRGRFSRRSSTKRPPSRSPPSAPFCVFSMAPARRRSAPMRGSTAATSPFTPSCSNPMARRFSRPRFRRREAMRHCSEKRPAKICGANSRGVLRCRSLECIPIGLPSSRAGLMWLRGRGFSL